MRLTYQSQGQNAWQKDFDRISKELNSQFVIALAGNPNTGKSTVFNALTGLNQHTGNWPGKTVIQVYGKYIFNDRTYTLVDLPGTYSLFANSVEEQIARDYICFAKPDATVVVTDATCLERNLNLVLQVMEITSKVVVCVNLLDEARRKKIVVNLKQLAAELGVPVVGTIARSGEGLKELQQTLEDIVQNRRKVNPRLPVYDEDIEKAIAEIIPEIIHQFGENLNPRWLALRVLEGDTSIFSSLMDPNNALELNCQTKKEVLA